MLAILVAVPFAEIALFIQLGQWIGLWWTLAGVVLTAIVGVLLVRAQGLSLMAEFRASAAAGGLPARPMAEALMVGLAGALLIVPGYFTDLIGLLLLIPPLRGAIYTALARRIRVVDISSGAPYPNAPEPPGIVDLGEGDWRDR